ncbi:MAG: right-handed parallel beta-helix repeat-containing protein [Methanomicrobia archaeon]|nr:right-handed parallel beta-helix repeat-containing protein [Methanomicrobia archaeon]
MIGKKVKAKEKKKGVNKGLRGNDEEMCESRSPWVKVTLLRRSLVAAFLLVFLLVLCTAGASAATTYTVCASGCDYTSIQAAVNAANPGDTIIVHDGTYTENVVVNKSLMIRSQNGAAVTTVQAADTGDIVFYVTADDVTICGFTVTGATEGYGIYLDGVQHCAILNNNASSNSIGIYLYDSSNNTLTCNTANYTGYGIFLYDSSSNTLSGNTANGNGGDGICLLSMWSSSSNNTLTCNTANGNGGDGIALLDSSSNTLSGNTANGNGGDGISVSYYWSSGSNNNELSCNTANGNGEDGIYLYYSSNNTLSCNTANENGADNILLHYSSNNNTLTGNDASEGVWYGIQVSYSSNNTLTGNDVSANGWDGIYLWGGSSNNTLTGNNVSANGWAGIHLFTSSNNSITCNLVANNVQRGFYLDWGSSGNNTGNTISNNTIMANGEYNATIGGWEWNFDNFQSDAVVAEDNYWGTDNSTVIAAGINENTGTVDYDPFLTDPAPCVPTDLMPCASTCSGSCPICPVPCYESPGPVPRVPITETATVLMIGLLALAGCTSVWRQRRSRT